jgi:hypothetical protein
MFFLRVADRVYCSQVFCSIDTALRMLYQIVGEKVALSKSHFPAIS